MAGSGVTIICAGGAKHLSATGVFGKNSFFLRIMPKATTDNLKTVQKICSMCQFDFLSNPHLRDSLVCDHAHF